MQTVRSFPFLAMAVCPTVACAPSAGPDSSGRIAPGTDAGASGGGGQGGSGGGGLGGTVGIGEPLPPRDPEGGRDPDSCEEAEQFRTYLGCVYFPTPLANAVFHPGFDFAVIVANPGDVPADIEVTGPGGFELTTTVAPGGLATLSLPWVEALRGPSLDGVTCTSGTLPGSVVARGGAYRLESSRPVAAYQFNPLRFVSSDGACASPSAPMCECHSFSNDASLLLPRNALTGNHRVFGWRDEGDPSRSKPTYVAITATEDDTEVRVELGPFAAIQAGDAIDAAGPGEVLTLDLNRGDVAQLVAEPRADLSGSLIQTRREGEVQKPVQVVSGSPSARVPDDATEAADHIEETVFPAETLGRDYVVTVPTGPDGRASRHVVRLYGNVDGTALSFYPAPPDGAPARLDAGEVVELGPLTADFQVQGSEPFAVGSFLVGGALLDPDTPPLQRVGDPSQSFMVAMQQYRERYIFLAPTDFERNFADVVAPADAAVQLDGRPLDPEGSGSRLLRGRADDGETELELRIYRVGLDGGPGGVGVHELAADVPIGLQVVGHARFTSYQYPGGLNLNRIAPPPPEIR